MEHGGIIVSFGKASVSDNYREKISPKIWCTSLLAQLVERETVNLEAAGSIPAQRAHIYSPIDVNILHNICDYDCS